MNAIAIEKGMKLPFTLAIQAVEELLDVYLAADAPFTITLYDRGHPERQASTMQEGKQIIRTLLFPGNLLHIHRGESLVYVLPYNVAKDIARTVYLPEEDRVPLAFSEEHWLRLVEGKRAFLSDEERMREAAQKTGDGHRGRPLPEAWREAVSRGKRLHDAGQFDPERYERKPQFEASPLPGDTRWIPLSQPDPEVEQEKKRLLSEKRRNVSEETRQKLSEAGKKKKGVRQGPMSRETRDKLSEAYKKRPHTPPVYSEDGLKRMAEARARGHETQKRRAAERRAKQQEAQDDRH
jgi:hypothetical protein